MPQPIKIRELDKSGIVKDTPAFSLPPNVWTDSRNVRFHDGSVSKMPGEDYILQQLHDTESTPNLVTPIHIKYWANPNVPEYVYADANNVYTISAAGTIQKINKTGHTYSNDGKWHSDLFLGGYALVLNNTVETPQYSIDFSQTGTIPLLQDLPGWDYGDRRKVVAGTLRTFNNVMIAGDITETVLAIAITAPNIVSGVEYEIVTLGNTTQPNWNTFAGTSGLTYAVGTKFTSAIAGTGSTTGTVGAVTVTRSPGTIRISTQAPAGSIPQTWQPGATADTADEFELSNTSPVVELVPLQGQMIAYTENSIHSVGITAQSSTTALLTDSYGCLGKDMVIEFDGRHFVVGSGDIYLFGGHPGSIKSLADGRVRRDFYTNLHPDYFETAFIVRNNAFDEIWICYPNLISLGPCNEALVWNYRQDTWTKRDIPNAFTGTQGPINGGGANSVQTLSLTGTTNSGEFDAADPHTDAEAYVADITISGTQSGTDTPAETETTDIAVTGSVGGTDTPARAEITELSLTGTAAGTDAGGAATKEETDIVFDGISGDVTPASITWQFDSEVTDPFVDLDRVVDTDNSDIFTLNGGDLAGIRVFTTSGGRGTENRPAANEVGVRWGQFSDPNDDYLLLYLRSDISYNTNDYVTAIRLLLSGVSGSVANYLSAGSSANIIPQGAFSSSGDTMTYLPTNSTLVFTVQAVTTEADLTMVVTDYDSSLTDFTVTLDTEHSASPITGTFTVSSSAISMAAQVRVAVTAASTTNLTIQTGTNATVELDSTTIGIKANITVLLEGGFGSTASTEITVSEGMEGATKTSYKITASSNHSPASLSSVFANDLTQANAIAQIRNHFVNNNIGGYSAGTLGATTFEVTSSVAGVDTPDLEFIITNAGTGGDLIAGDVVTTQGRNIIVNAHTVYTVVTSQGTQTITLNSGTTAAEALASVRLLFTNGTITGFTPSVIADSKFTLTDDTPGAEADITLTIIQSGTGGDLGLTATVTNDGADLVVNPHTIIRINSNSNHDPVIHTLTLDSGLTQAQSLVELRNVFVNDLVGDYTAGAISGSTFTVTSDNAVAESPNLDITITQAGTNGDLGIATNVTNEGVTVVPSLAGSITLQIPSGDVVIPLDDLTKDAAIVAIAAALSGNSLLNVQTDTTADTVSITSRQLSVDGERITGTVFNAGLNPNGVTPDFLISFAETSTTSPFRPWPINEFNLSREFIVMSSGSNLTASDLGFTDADNAPYESFVERTHSDLGDTMSTKDISAIYPLADGEGEMYIKISVIDFPGATVDMSSDSEDKTLREYEFTPSEGYKVNSYASGRLINVRFGDTGTDEWRLTGYDFDADFDGGR